MPTYVCLVNWTEQGIGNIKDSPSRLDQFKEAVSAAGGEVKATYLTMGRHDLVTIVEAPDDETYAKLALSVGSKGSVRTETLRAFTEDEYRRLIGEL